MITLTLYQYLLDHQIDVSNFDRVAFVILFKGIEWTFIFNVNAQEFHVLSDLINVHNLKVELNLADRLLILKDQVVAISAEGGWQRGLANITSNVAQII